MAGRRHHPHRGSHGHRAFRGRRKSTHHARRGFHRHPHKGSHGHRRSAHRTAHGRHVVRHVTRHPGHRKGHGHVHAPHHPRVFYLRAVKKRVHHVRVKHRQHRPLTIKRITSASKYRAARRR